jgi:hypothetical protein
MAGKIVAGAAAMPLAALVLAACVSQSAYDEQASQLELAQAQVAAQQAEIAKMQAENRWVMAGDLLFPEGGYELGAAGQAALSQHVPQLKSVQNAKLVVYGFTDNAPVGPALQLAGIADNHVSRDRIDGCRGRDQPGDAAPPRLCLQSGKLNVSMPPRQVSATLPEITRAHGSAACAPRIAERPIIGEKCAGLLCRACDISGHQVLGRRHCESAPKWDPSLEPNQVAD